MVIRKLLFSTRMRSCAVEKPTTAASLTEVTGTRALRGPERTAHDASSGRVPFGPRRMRSTSSRRAAILMIADPLRISTPSGVALKVSTELKIRTCADAAARQNRATENDFIISRAGGTLHPTGSGERILRFR